MKIELPKILNDVLQSVTKHFQKTIDREVNQSSGGLQDSVKTTVDQDSVNIEMEKYGEVVDKGRRPGSMPPTTEIKKWMAKNSVRGNSEKTTDQIAFAIATDIKKKGTKPQPFIEKAVDGVIEDILVDELENDIAQQVENEIEQNLEDVTIKLNL